MNIIVKRKPRSDEIETTRKNVVVKLESEAIKCLHEMSLEEANRTYMEINKNLTKQSTENRGQ